MEFNGHHFEKYISSTEINQLVERLAFKIDQDYKGKNLIIIGVLNGAFIFLSDLVKKMSLDPDIEFVKYSSYTGVESSGQVKNILALEKNIKNRHVLIVEDIIDTGNTLVRLASDLSEKGAASLNYATLFLKPDVYKKDISINYIGKKIPADFVIGYGMDIDGKGRGLENIYRLS